VRAPSTKPAAGLGARPLGQPEKPSSGNRKGVELHRIVCGRVELTSETAPLTWAGRLRDIRGFQLLDLRGGAKAILVAIIFVIVFG
jgi:hypothetical protein